jgi:hypothetical protein
MKEKMKKWASTVAHCLKRMVIYIFKRRLAIKPGRPSYLHGVSSEKRLFQWQKMPTGYRWF